MTQDPFYTSQAAVDAGGTSRKRGPWIIILIIVVILLLCCCAVLVFGWFEGDRIVQMLRDMGVNISLSLPLLI